MDRRSSDLMAMTRGPLGWLKHRWDVMRSGLWLGLGQYGGDYRRLDRTYLVRDPWKLNSERERWRFELTNAAISRHVPDCGSLLELGTGEGVQTAYLMRVAHGVTGIEVSAVAAERARAQAPGAEILVGPAEQVAELVGERRFDLVTACEILYFVPRTAEVLEACQRLAPRLLVTSYEKRARQLAHYFCGPGWERLDDIVSAGTRWRCYLWSRPQD